MSEYKNGRIILNESAAKLFLEKIHHPSATVLHTRKQFLNGISQNITILSASATEVVADIQDFDDSVIDQPEWCQQRRNRND